MPADPDQGCVTDNVDYLKPFTIDAEKFYFLCCFMTYK